MRNLPTANMLFRATLNVRPVVPIKCSTSWTRFVKLASTKVTWRRLDSVKLVFRIDGNGHGGGGGVHTGLKENSAVQSESARLHMAPEDSLLSAVTLIFTRLVVRLATDVLLI